MVFVVIYKCSKVLGQHPSLTSKRSNQTSQSFAERFTARDSFTLTMRPLLRNRSKCLNPSPSITKTTTPTFTDLFTNWLKKLQKLLNQAESKSRDSSMRPPQKRSYSQKMQLKL